ncbi:GAF domain-containing protein [Aliikangiella coralliicola]|uniref:GAF domain-containing protein n=1 Tax=Aliikangiella coralliicola TaxID=2592383 RepID=A0A545UFS3_9GAMM|nr:GAF domain-containing protein [Aliikangiella coralliicola]TQV88320.1 GAF domain-containing protein [Aliikangiella coralliicola]
MVAMNVISEYAIFNRVNWLVEMEFSPVIELTHYEVPTEIKDIWQQTVDIIADIANVPACLIMRVLQNDIEVYVSSDSEGNPYRVGELAKLESRLYCEMVMDTNSQLLVPNALKDPDWDSNPDIELGMIAYLGEPVNWPDGSRFGTICILDCKEVHFNQKVQQFLKLMKENIELYLSQFFYRKSAVEYEPVFEAKKMKAEKILLHEDNQVTIEDELTHSLDDVLVSMSELMMDTAFSERQLEEMEYIKQGVMHSLELIQHYRKPKQH